MFMSLIPCKVGNGGGMLFCLERFLLEFVTPNHSFPLSHEAMGKNAWKGNTM